MSARAAVPDTPLNIVLVSSLGTLGENIPSLAIPTDLLTPLARHWHTTGQGRCRAAAVNARLEDAGPSHYRLDLVHPAEHRCAASGGRLANQRYRTGLCGVQQRGAPVLSDVTAYSWLG